MISLTFDLLQIIDILDVTFIPLILKGICTLTNFSKFMF